VAVVRPADWQGEQDLISVECLYFGEPIDMQPVIVHPLIACQGRPGGCCIHAPSEHHMKTWTQVWDDGMKIMYRRCEHDGLHPDPDHVAFFLSQSGGQTISMAASGALVSYAEKHDCDGCCAPPAPEQMST
jgi:hypothetical protein